VGEPVEHRGIVLAPLFPRSRSRSRYITLDEALGLGFRTSEVSAQGSVPEVLVTNPTGANVIVCDGEQLVGAKQNRIVNVTVLVAAQQGADPGLLRRAGSLEHRLGRLLRSKSHPYPELRRLTFFVF
jgi:hypothetical protein